MSLTLATNVASINTQKWLGVSGAAQSKALEQLSSGAKINKAADDAAGSAISTKLNVKAASIGKAIDNGNQAIAMLQTAESGMSTIADILTRLKELATEASSDNNATDRTQLQSERVQLELQINNISANTKYGATKLLVGGAALAGTTGGNITAANGINSVSGTNPGAYKVTNTLAANGKANLTITSMSGNSQTINVTVPTAGTTSDIYFDSLGVTVQVNSSFGGAAHADSGGGAVAGTLDAAFGGMAGSIKVTTTTGSTNIDVTGVTALDDATHSANTLVGRIRNAGITGVTAAVSAAGKLDITNTTGAAITVDTSGVTKGSVGEATSSISVANNATTTAVNNADLGSMAGTLNINGTSIDLTGVTALDDASHTMNTLVGRITAASVTGVTATAANGILTLTSAANTPTVVDESGVTAGNIGWTLANKQTAAGNAFSVVSSGSGTTTFSYQLGDTSASSDQVTASIGSMSLSALGLSVTVNTLLVTWSNDDAGKAGAQAYLDALSGGADGTQSTGVNYVNAQKSGIGAAQNQINYQISNLENTLQNTESAASTIKDTDYAASMSEFTKYQVMTQAGVAMLAQSNQLPQQILTLLRG